MNRDQNSNSDGNRRQTDLREKWFAIRTRSRSEKKVDSRLKELGYNSYLPLEATYRIWSDRKKKLELPLIPSVVFVKDLTVDKKPIYEIPGFASILRMNGKIGEITQQEIDHLKLLTSGDLDYENCSSQSFLKGEEVEIISGPFIGLWAKAIEEVNNYRILIEIKSLDLSFRVNVPKNRVRRISKAD